MPTIVTRMDIASLKYPKKSHRKQILLPEESVALAEFMGIELGDGGINNPWQVVITLNAQADFDYSSVVNNLVKSLFNLEAHSFKRGKNTLVLSFSSTELVDFLVSKGAPRGNKLRKGAEVDIWEFGVRESICKRFDGY